MSTAGAPFDLFRFWVMLSFSLATLSFALLPFPLYFLGLSDATVWRVSSLLLASFTVANAVVIGRLIRRRVPAVVSSLEPGISVAAQLTYAITLVTQVANLLGFLGGPRFGLYLVGLLMVLIGAGVNFVRLVWLGTSRLGPPAG